MTDPFAALFLLPIFCIALWIFLFISNIPNKILLKLFPMKSKQQRVLVFFGTLVSLYLIGSFMSWQANPAKWIPEGRAIGTIISIVIALAASLIDLTENKPE